MKMTGLGRVGKDHMRKYTHEQDANNVTQAFKAHRDVYGNDASDISLTGPALVR